MLSVLLLGTPQLAYNGEPISLTRRKSRALVYYLASHTRPLTRDHLLAFFWPDIERAAAQQVLRTTLHGLRKTLGASLLTEDDTLALAQGSDIDVRTFEANLQLPASNLQTLISTLQLYRGDFLLGFSLPDSPQFDDWASVERERYQRLAVRGLTALSRLHEAAGDYTAALDAIDRALAFSALQEDLQRIALRLHYLAGDRAGAIRRYEAFRKLLDEEMGVPPMAETRALYHAVITDNLPTPETGSRRAVRLTPSAGPTSAIELMPFVGRSAELKRLQAFARAGAHPLVLIEGEAGIGKTRLAEEFAQASLALSLAGKARELEQALPYQPIIDALRSLLVRTDWPALQATLRAHLPAVWLNEAARLLPELVDHFAPGAADESRLWESIHQLLLTLARQRQVVFFLDDAQWADAATLALAGYLARQIDDAGAPIVYLAAARTITPRTALAGLVQNLTREGRLQRISLSRLSPEEIAALAQRVSPDRAPALAEWLARLSEGNPYILVECIRYAREKGILSASAFNAKALSSSPIVPQTVYTLIESRLGNLSDAARRVLDTAVAAGREFEFEVVAQAAALSEDAALDALDELQTAGLIHPQDLGEQRYVFDHSLTMEVAYRQVGEPRHRLLHRRVAEALEAAYGRSRIDAVAGLLASHFNEGHAPDRAAPYALRAARLAANLAAWKEAAAFYEMALAGTGEKKRSEIYLALGDACLRAGEFARAAEALRAALSTLEPGSDEAASARLLLGQSLLSQARYAEAIALVEEVRASGHPRSAARAELMWGTALSVEGADLASAAEHLRAAEALMGEHANPAQLAQVKFEQGSVAAQQGDLRRAIALYRDALGAAQSARPDAQSMEILALNNLAYHLHLLNDPSTEECAHAGLKLAQDSGSLGVQTYLLSTLGEIALARGDLDAAEKLFSDGLALAESFSAAERIAGLTANLGLVAHKRGETTLAIHRLSTALARADSIGTQHLAAQVRLWLAPLLPPAEAQARLAEARAIAESSGRRRLLDEATRLEAQLRR